MLKKLKKKISDLNKSPWAKLETEEEWEQLITDSYIKPVMLFKHSTRCALSSMAKGRIERDFENSENKISMYLLDLVRYRALSSMIAEDTGIPHESPQLFLIYNGKSIFNTSHNGISADAVLTALKDKNL